MTTTLSERLARLDELMERATKGEWRTPPGSDVECFYVDPKPNSELFVELKAIYPELSAYVRGLHNMVEQWDELTLSRDRAFADADVAERRTAAAHARASEAEVALDKFLLRLRQAGLLCLRCDGKGVCTITTGDGSHGTLELEVCSACEGSGFADLVTAEARAPSRLTEEQEAALQRVSGLLTSRVQSVKSAWQRMWPADAGRVSSVTQKAWEQEADAFKLLLSGAARREDTPPSRTLPVILRPGMAGWVVAECPAFVGCISQGRTREEALANIRGAIEFCFELGEPSAGELIQVPVPKGGKDG